MNFTTSASLPSGRRFTINRMKIETTSACQLAMVFFSESLRRHLDQFLEQFPVFHRRPSLNTVYHPGVEADQDSFFVPQDAAHDAFGGRLRRSPRRLVEDRALFLDRRLVSPGARSGVVGDISFDTAGMDD